MIWRPLCTRFPPWVRRIPSLRGGLQGGLLDLGPTNRIAPAFIRRCALHTRVARLILQSGRLRELDPWSTFPPVRPMKAFVKEADR